MNHDQDKDFDALVEAEAAKLKALSPEQRTAIVAACTQVIACIAARGTLVLLSRTVDKESQEYAVRTDAWGSEGAADVSELLLRVAEHTLQSAMRDASGRTNAPATVQ